MRSFLETVVCFITQKGKIDGGIFPNTRASKTALAEQLGIAPFPMIQFDIFPTRTFP